ncbi:AAA family ATPase [Izhakiella australiensis]|uniref:AAA family ATPase n=1 Tax=Izhakiella australiensis TaxID=1926881 RepID=A0A1S8YLT8_9GAMM|nr:AAA family ATPase [Izhakiella australiensis]OON39835.1 AAA family ATPase [Izhakiella australiensis]
MTYSPTRKPTTLLLGDSPLSPLLRELERIDLTLLRYYYRLKPLHDRFLPWLLSEDEVEARLLHPAGRPHWVAANQVPSLAAEVQSTTSDKLTALIDRFELTDFERDSLLLGLLPHFDSRYHELFSVIQGGSLDPLPSFSLSLALFCHSDGERRAQQASFLHQAPLIACQLLAIDENKKNLSWSQTRFITDSSIYHFLLGHDYLAPTLASWVEWLPPPAIPFFPTCLKEALAEVLLTEDNEPHPVVLLRGTPGSNRANAVAAIFASENRDTLMVDIDNGDEHDDRSLLSHMKSLLRETRMRAAGIVIRNLQSRLEKKTPLLEGLSSLFSQPGLRIVCLIEPYGPPAWLKKTPTLQLDMPALTPEEKAQLLTDCLPAPGLPETDLISLSQRYTFNPQSLPLILREAALYRRQRDPMDILQPGDLRKALNLRAQQNFGRLAQRITPVRTLNDLLVSDDLMKQLKEILAAIRYRERVLADGFKDKVGYGVGISALFYGDSGTGKTMAAEVLASTLGVDLIKVDLSTVINKYIGETEKNLSHIFDLAEQDAGILFFDEADALFGKRSETKDAHDRHANIEVAYLLQRLENYPGLVILSTNNRSHLDSAFNRRFTFITRFTYPDETLRIKMWQEIWPKNIKLSSEVDFNQLAQSAHITGANIRNIALMASFFAAEQGSEAVGQHHIDTALARELAKNGRLVL